VLFFFAVSRKLLVVSFIFMRIIGITGMIGAGKGTVVEHLKAKGFKHYSARALFIKKLKEQGKPIEGRTAFHDMANELRRDYGPSYIIEELVREAQAGGDDAIVESVHGIGEVEALKHMGAFLLGIDADQRIRYERVLKRKSETDNDLTFERFVAEEEADAKNDDPLKQNLFACIAQADAVIRNDGTLEELHQSIDRALEKLG
jgi:dephospho-CoA kinase